MSSRGGPIVKITTAMPRYSGPPPAYMASGPLSPDRPETSYIPDETWMNKVKNRINLARPMDHPSVPCTIFQVPNHIRWLDGEGKAYQPVIAYLGPFHDAYNDEYHKWQCVRHLLSRHGNPRCASTLLEDCLLELKKQDDKVRSCYSQEFPDLNDQEMALIMLLDGCFIIHVMLEKHGMEEETEEEQKESSNEEIEGEETEEEHKESSNKEIEGEEIGEEEIEGEEVVKQEVEATKEDEGKKRREHMVEIREGEVVIDIDEKDKKLEGRTGAGLFTFELVVYDLLKLENQIPFFIIQLLFDKLEICKDVEINLVDLALQLFKDIHPKVSKSFRRETSPSSYHHLLHLFYSSRIPSKKLEVSAPSQERRQGTTLTSAPRWIPSATELDRAGVKFKKNERADNFLSITFGQRMEIMLSNLCLKFRSGRMEIPPLQIYDYTGHLFRNLIAFEQCYFDTEMYITIYAIFMDCIIDQAEDVRLLRLGGILEHGLSNDQVVADLFNQLGNQTHFIWEKIYLANQIEEVNKFYNFKWHRRLADLRRNYLGSPWALISLLAAVFLLLLTIEQAAFSALSYFHS